MNTKTARRMARVETVLCRIRRQALAEVKSLDKLVHLKPEHFRAAEKLRDIATAADAAAASVTADHQPSLPLNHV
ncbi:MAG: hypothetical protein H3C27_08620 [Opitutaceae bacterium]|nr:hypothetical protein [Opitutaceae bacterium]